jgi:peptide/nickel transport system substrate-binding protein
VRAIPLFLAVTLAASCNRGAARPLTLLIAQDILSADPNREVETITDSVLFNVYEPLVGFDEQLGIRPMLAESWEHPRPEQWRFRLRKNARFHDGTPLSAALVRDALVALRDSRDMEAAEFLSPVSEITLVDDLTLDLVTAEPRALLANLGVVYITKKNTQAFPPLAGTGPYRLREWVPGARVSLERFDGYYGAPPSFAQVVFTPRTDPQERLRLVREGKADIAYDAPPEGAARPDAGVRFVHRQGVRVYYLGLNLRANARNPFGDVRVRRALHLALNRPRLVGTALLGYGAVATQPAPPQAFGFDPGLPEPQPDPLRARALLSEAGYPNGFKARLDVFSERLPVARLVREDLASIGVELELNAVGKNEVYRLANAGESDLFLASWSFSSGEASEFYEACLHTPSAGYGYNNYGGYSNARLDAIAEKNAAILDPVQRRDQLQRAAVLAMDELPVIPLYVGADIYALSGAITFKPRADGEIWLPDVHPAR